MDRLEFATLDSAQQAADRIHLKKIQVDADYARSAADGKTTAWAIPYRGGAASWCVNVKGRGRSGVNSPDIPKLKPIGGSDFDPKTLAALQYWVDAGAITGVADGGAIAAADVTDQSSSTRGAFSARVNLNYRADAGNYRPAIEYNGTDSYGRGPSFALSQPLTIFSVIKILSPANIQRAFDGNTVNKVVLATNGSSGKIASLSMYAGTAYSPEDDTNDVGSIALVECVYNGASSKIRVNDGATKTGNPGTNGLTNGMIFGAAGGLNAGFFLNFQNLEVMVFDSTLTAEDKAKVRAYLIDKHSIVTRGLLICDGNSLTSGTGAGAGEDYPAQLLTLLGGASAYRKFNYGVGGQTTQQMMADAGTQIDTRRDNFARAICVAWEIGNDIKLNNLDGATAYANFVSYCQARQSAGFKVIALTVPPRGDLTGAKETARTDANSMLRANWETFADALCDVAADARLSNEKNTTYFSDDTVHMKAAGYGAVAELVKATMDTIQ